MSDCCDTFSTSTTSAIREPNFHRHGLDDCGDKAVYVGVTGGVFKSGTPVKWGTAPGTVEPALDGVGAIGISSSDLTATATVNRVTVQRNGHAQWGEIAAAIDATGAAATNLATWWALHKELAKINLYVEFN